ncbi:MAG TPA: helix-turn-helix domain-containing protein [Candidatus Limnocylindria bacterium]|nr:helix-turn-helix domain-containing protein [Candidatus Limnocylindria bacterium]
MSRLGDLLHMERMRRKLTAREVAKLTGVSEKYLLEVEAGSRIIQDSQARRMMAKMGVVQTEESAFTLEDIASTVDLQSAVSAVRGGKDKPREAEKPVPADGSIWIDALKGVLQHVPVYNAVMKEVQSRLLPVNNGKIEGAPAEKVFYFMAPDNRMRGFRVQQGDLVLVVPSTAAEDGRMMLLDTPMGKQLYMLKVLPRYELLLQTYDRQYESEIVPMADVRVIGRCVRLEAELT